MKKYLMPPPYAMGIHIFLSCFRFFSFALAIALIFVVPNVPPPNLQMIVVIGLLSIYTILKVLFHFHLWQRDAITYTVLGGDLVVCVALVLLTDGADSPFLLYSLLPVVTTALYFEQRLALIIASLTSLNLIVAHVGLTYISSSYTPILQENYLSLVAVYTIFCFLTATMTYQTNLNVYRHIQSKTIVEERRKLRREIHDGIAQVMGYLNTKTSLLKKSPPSSYEKLHAELDEIDKVVSESYEDIREAIDNLTIEGGPVSLVAELSRHTKELGQKTGMKTEYTAPKELPGVHPVVQLQLYRIAQEALNNVRKHASANQVWVEIENMPQGTLLVVKDNGCGFSTSTQKGTGIRIMEERVESINGTMTVASSPGQGTEVRVNVPRR